MPEGIVLAASIPGSVRQSTHLGTCRMSALLPIAPSRLVPERPAELRLARIFVMDMQLHLAIIA